MKASLDSYCQERLKKLNFTGLPQKKLIDFLRRTGAFLSLLILFSIVFAPAAQAGFLNAIKKLFSGYKETSAASEEVASTQQSFVAPHDAVFERENIFSLSLGDDGSLTAPLIPFPQLTNFDRAIISTYEVKEGDTLSSIAQEFDVSINTLLWANDLKSAHQIQPGDTLIVLPVSGTKHEVKRGDTVDTLVKRYRGDYDEIIQFNGLPADGSLKVGSVVIIPDGELDGQIALPKSLTNVLSDLKGYFSRPIAGGILSRGIHGWNAVDLATACGQPIFASASGTIIRADDQGWNSGYGNFLAISHPNGVQTLYAHASELLTYIGQQVKQGQVVALVGSTGKSTGCHLHFEVRGAKNPFAK